MRPMRRTLTRFTLHEVAWFRVLTLAFGGSTYASALIGGCARSAAGPCRSPESASASSIACRLPGTPS
jgi:hypothetical protein